MRSVHDAYRVTLEPSADRTRGSPSRLLDENPRAVALCRAALDECSSFMTEGDYMRADR